MGNRSDKIIQKEHTQSGRVIKFINSYQIFKLKIYQANISIMKVNSFVFLAYFKACNINLMLLFFVLYTTANVFQVAATFKLSRLTDNSSTLTKSSVRHKFLIYFYVGLSNCSHIQNSKWKVQLLLNSSLCLNRCVFTAGRFFVRSHLRSMRPEASRLTAGLYFALWHAVFRVDTARPHTQSILGWSRSRRDTHTRGVQAKFTKRLHCNLGGCCHFDQHPVVRSLSSSNICAIFRHSSINFLFNLIQELLFNSRSIFKRVYIRYSRQTKRLESVSRSPIYAFFAESLSGMSTIRAFGEQERYVTQMQSYVDQNVRIYLNDMFGNRYN